MSRIILALYFMVCSIVIEVAILAVNCVLVQPSGCLVGSDASSSHLGEAWIVSLYG